MVKAVHIDTRGQLLQITINMDDFKAPQKFLKTDNVTFVGAIDDLVLMASNDPPGTKELNSTNIPQLLGHEEDIYGDILVLNMDGADARDVTVNQFEFALKERLDENEL